MSNLQICSSPAVFSSMRALNISELFSISFNVGQNKDNNYFLHFRFLGTFFSVTGLIIPASKLNSSSGVNCEAGFIAPFLADFQGQEYNRQGIRNNNHEPDLDVSIFLPLI